MFGKFGIHPLSRIGKKEAFGNLGIIFAILAIGLLGLVSHPKDKKFH